MNHNRFSTTRNIRPGALGFLTLERPGGSNGPPIGLSNLKFEAFKPGGGGGGVLPNKRLLGMCRWMGSHFHNWTDYSEVTFLVELLGWGRTFSGFLG